MEEYHHLAIGKIKRTVSKFDKCPFWITGIARTVRQNVFHIIKTFRKNMKSDFEGVLYADSIVFQAEKGGSSEIIQFKTDDTAFFLYFLPGKINGGDG